MFPDIIVTPLQSYNTINCNFTPEKFLIYPYVNAIYIMTHGLFNLSMSRHLLNMGRILWNYLDFLYCFGNFHRIKNAKSDMLEHSAI